MTKTYIESCFFLTPKRAEQSLNRIRKIGDNTDYQRKDIRYNYKEENDKVFLFVTVGSNAPQKILLEQTEPSDYFLRDYFRCECGCRVTKLYLLPDGSCFKCKKCHNLKYQVQSFNKSSKHGKIFLETSRILKLMNERENIDRIFYNSAYTKRFNKWLDSALELGMVEMVREARVLESIVNTNHRKS